MCENPSPPKPSPSSIQPPFAHYRTKDMVLVYDNALAAGDTETDVTV